MGGIDNDTNFNFVFATRNVSDFINDFFKKRHYTPGCYNGVKNPFLALVDYPPAEAGGY